MVTLKFVKMVMQAVFETHELICPKCKARLKVLVKEKQN